jgi:hypothetical protein
MQSKTEKETKDKNTRRIARIALTLPVKVEGKDSKDKGWDEITRLKDISAFGAGFTLRRPVKRGRLLLLTLPMPRKMRCYDYLESQYRVWAIVRRCIKGETRAEEGLYLIGVAFIGNLPPKSYLEDPALIYEISDRNDDGLWEIDTAPREPLEEHLSKEDRRHSRYEIPLNVTVEVTDPEGNVLRREDTVTENISISGASVFSSIELEIGSFIKLSCKQYSTSIKAVVRGKRLGPDGIPRLHIEFIDSYFPLEGIDS